MPPGERTYWMAAHAEWWDEATPEDEMNEFR
jgi:hypothetical protein